MPVPSTPVVAPSPVAQQSINPLQPRRVALAAFSGLGITLVGNLFGVSSFLLGLDGGKNAASSRLDAIIPVKGFKRCIDYQNGFEFLYPATWLADQRLYRRYAERIERSVALDLPSLRNPPRRIKKDVYEPSAAYGPPGSTGEDNMSVVVAPIRDGFSLQKMGTPEEAAERFMQSVAPANSNKVATLITAGSRRDPIDGELYYVMEFLVEAPGKFKRHNVAVYGARNGLLYTFNAQAGEDRYTPELAAAYAKSAASFRMTSSGASTAGFPDRL